MPHSKDLQEKHEGAPKHFKPIRMPDYIVHLDARLGASIVLKDTKTKENCYGNSVLTRRFFVLNSVEHGILNARKYKNIKKFENCWHFNIYEREKFHAQLS